MRITTSVRPLLVLLAVHVAGAAVAETEPAAAPSTIFLVRHAEKSAPKGDVPLSSQGHARAAALASMLRDAGVGHIYTSQMIRARQTAAPLERRLGLTASVVPVEDVDALVQKLKGLPGGSVALVVNHSNTIPKVIEKLGGSKVSPIQENEYDRLIVLTRTGGTLVAVTIRFDSASAAAPK